MVGMRQNIPPLRGTALSRGLFPRSLDDIVDPTKPGAGTVGDIKIDTLPVNFK